MACRRTLNQVKTAVVAFVPTPEERTAQQLAEEQVKQAQQSEKKVKVGVTAAGGEEKVKDEL